MIVTLIAAHSLDGFLSQEGRIPWHLPEDVAHFRSCCAGRWLLLGRRTWDQMQGWFRPDHIPVVVTRNPALTVPGGHAAASVASGISLAEVSGAAECVVIGGGQIYEAALPLADRLILTTVQIRLGTGDASFPDFSMDDWQEMESHHHPADTRHAFAFTVRWLQRRAST